MQYDIGEDPSNRPTGAQKATVFFSIILFRMCSAAMFCNPASLEEYERQSNTEKILGTFAKGIASAVITIPSTVLLDRMFMKAQKRTNVRKQGDETESEVAKLAKLGMKMVLESVDTRSALSFWYFAVEQLKVDMVRKELDNRHLKRMNTRSDMFKLKRAEFSKSMKDLEVQRMCSIYDPIPRLAEFPNLVANISRKLSRKSKQVTNDEMAAEILHRASAVISAHLRGHTQRTSSRTPCGSSEDDEPSVYHQRLSETEGLYLRSRGLFVKDPSSQNSDDDEGAKEVDASSQAVGSV
eukprot:6641089-Prymnesium_polylepis.1